MTADYSAARRRTIMRTLADVTPRPEWATLDENARITYVVGMLVCSPIGFVAKNDLEAACADPSVVNYARQLLRRAGDRK